MPGWSQFEAAAPELAEAGRKLLYQFGPGLGFLATVRKDGGPRLHPVCPLIVEGALYVFIERHSPKRHDLRRDGRYALHSFPAEDRDDEFCVSGRAHAVDNDERRAAVSAAVAAQGTLHGEDATLFEFDIDRALHAAYRPRSEGWAPPAYRKWQA